MTNIIDETAGWPDVPLIATRDLVLGGPGGPSNKQAIALAARTELLRENQKRTPLHFGSFAEATAAARGLPDGQVVEVSQDETRAAARTRYKVQAGALANRIEWLCANAGGISAPVNLGNGGTAKAINAAQASAFRINLNQPSCALSITGAGATQSIRLLLVQGSGANKVTWPSGVKWPYGAPPVLSYDQRRTDMVTLETHDGGGTWFGFFNGGGF